MRNTRYPHGLQRAFGNGGLVTRNHRYSHGGIAPVVFIQHAFTNVVAHLLEKQRHALPEARHAALFIFLGIMPVTQRKTRGAIALIKRKAAEVERAGLYG